MATRFQNILSFAAGTGWGRAALALGLGALLMAAAIRLGPPAESMSDTFQVPAGWTVEKVAGAPLIEYPLFMYQDDRGRLYVAEGTGQNIGGPEVYPMKLGKIKRLEDRDEDGVFETGTTFADGLVLPQGVLWHQGAVYVSSHPYIWRLEDADDDGVAERREPLIGKFAFNGNGNDIKGPFAGPDGWLYWTHGRHGYKLQTKEGDYLEGMASRIWRGRFDGSAIERIAGGGFDNPVELVWTQEGDLIGTMDQWEGDALLHYVLGGVYPQGQHPAIGEFPMTGRLLGQVTSFSPAFPAALCGLVRLRTDYFGPEARNTLLSAHYNVKRLQQHTLLRQGSTYRSINRNFLVSTDTDFHPTDVLEDADGSLLVLDMGAWFTYGCPTAGLNPKPEAKGVIYRVRRRDASPPQDPWGKSLQLAAMAPPQLIDLLQDPRPKVRDRAVEELVRRGEAAVGALGEALQKDGRRAQPALPAEMRLQTLWALSRIGTPAARARVRAALGDAEPAIRQAAAHSAGLERDAEALTELSRLVVKDHPAVRLKAAEALGRIGRPQAAAVLLESLAQDIRDPFLEHALIYALIEIGEPAAAEKALADVNSRVRRAGLIALDQMKPKPDASGQSASLIPQAAPRPVNYETENYLDGERVKITSYKHVGGQSLQLTQILPLLDTDNPALRQAAQDIIARREGWLPQAAAHPARLIGQGRLEKDSDGRALMGVILTYPEQAEVQQAVASGLTGPGTSEDVRALLLQALARVRMKPFPTGWTEGVGAALRSSSARLQEDAVQVIWSQRLDSFDSQLQELSLNSALPARLRIAALSAGAARRPALAPPQFELLTGALEQSSDSLLRLRAAEALGSSRLSADQLAALIPRIEKGDAVIVPQLTNAFLDQRDGALGKSLVQALLSSPGAAILTSELLQRLLKDYPEEVRQAAQPLYSARAGTYDQERDYLAQFMTRLQVSEGNVERGEKVFSSPQAGCATCHSVAGKGGTIGPELVRLRSRRGIRSVLEKIVFPHNTILPGYRSHVVTLEGGKSVTGLIMGESGDTVFVTTADLSEIRIERNKIRGIQASTLSIMPPDLEKAIPPEELNDLLEYVLAH